MKRRGPSWKQVAGKWQPVILEEDVVDEITRRLWWQYRIKVWRIRERIPGEGKLSMAGIPDLLGWVAKDKPTGNAWPPDSRCAIPLFIECKRPGGARRTAQIQFITEAKGDGCVAFFAESWHDVVNEMEKHGLKVLREAA